MLTLRSLITLTLTPLLGLTLSAEELIRERFDGPGAAVHLLGDARLADGHLELTGEGRDALGAVWFTPAVVRRDRRVLVNADVSFRAHPGLAVGGSRSPGGGLQIVLQFGESLDALGTGGDELGTGDFPGRYVGVALDLGPDSAQGILVPHLELNVDANPSRDAPRAASTKLPPLPPEPLDARLRLTITLRERSLRVLVTSESDCYRARRIVDATLPPLPDGPLTVGVTGATTSYPVTQRVHAVTVRSDAAPPAFVRGDCNQDGRICGDVSDMVAIVLHCFQGGAAPRCEAACDANDDGTVCGSVTDVAYLANFCFLGAGPRPPEPAGSCGVDPSPDALGCEAPLCGSASESPLVYLGENERGFEEHWRARDGMIMVRLPGGSFEQGDHFEDIGEDELPVHRVILSGPFDFAKHEVTNSQYRLFLDAVGCGGLGCEGDDPTWDYTGPMGIHEARWDGCHYPAGTTGFAWGRNESYFEDPRHADHPVVWIDWFDAVAYGRWASGTTSTDWSDPAAYGIPSESQWEFAARWNGDGRLPSRYPWGGSAGSMNDTANINGDICNHGQIVNRTTSVCSYPEGRSHFGVYNQAGNVYEWTADWYDGDSYRDAPLHDPFVTEGELFRQLRGGGWFGPPFSVRGAYRCNFPQNRPDVDVGIRCATPAAR